MSERQSNADPYEKPGLYAVCQNIFLGYSQNMATHAEQDGLAYYKGNPDSWANCVNENALADSTFNAAVSHVVTQGWTVDKAWEKSQKGVGGNYNHPQFTKATLQSACDFASKYLQYK